MADALNHALTEVEDELRDARRERRHLNERIGHLEQARAGLRGILGMDLGESTAGEADGEAGLRSIITEVLLAAREPLAGNAAVDVVRETSAGALYAPSSIYETMRLMSQDPESAIVRTARNTYAHVFNAPDDGRDVR
jgi:hypothetical protein